MNIAILIPQSPINSLGHGTIIGSPDASSLGLSSTGLIPSGNNFFSLHNSLMVPVALQRILSVLDHQNEVLGISTIVTKTLPMIITSITLLLCSFLEQEHLHTLLKHQNCQKMV